MSEWIALIAGAGRFPFHIAQEAKRQGLGVVALGMRGWADPALAADVDAYEEIELGQLGHLMARLKHHRVMRAIMAGKVTKAVLLNGRSAFDAEMLSLLARVKNVSVGALLGAVAERLGQEGVEILDSSTFLKSQLCPVGVLTVRRPTPQETEDVRIGQQAARAVATLDIGQTVVVKERVVIAVEALEGTDAAIRRAHALARDGLVVVKAAAANQDRRFDLPVIGTETLTVLQETGVSCLAMEAGSTLLLEREALIAGANAAKICLLGIAVPASC